MKSSGPPADRLRVAVFAKAPVAGEVKTRLIETLGEAGAAQLHASLVRHALFAATLAGVGRVELWCAPDETHAFFGECARDMGARLHRQQGGNLGARMAHAFEASLSAGRQLILIGSDCPALAAGDIERAAVALASHDAVMTPAEDGGYVLVGLSRRVPGLFDGIAWSTASVMEATRQRLRKAGARWHELPTRWDVDRPEDYTRLQREGLLQEMPS
jgi:rSAM/selenodomain-associated transferase 1